MALSSQINSGKNDKTTELLVSSGLQAIIQKYGEVSVISVHPPTKKASGSLDVQVVSAPLNNEAFQKIFNEVGRSAGFNAFYAGEKEDPDFKKKYSNVWHMSMSKTIDSEQWEVTVWFVSDKEAEKAGGIIEVPKQKKQKAVSLSKTGVSPSKNPFSLTSIGIYLAVVLVIFFGTLAVLNRTFNDEWGFRAQLDKKTEIPEELVEEVAEETQDEAQVEEEITVEEVIEAPEEEASLETSTTTPTSTPVDSPTPIEEEKEKVVEEILPDEVCEFNNNLRVGDSGEEIAELQRFLGEQGENIYPEGLVSGYFGILTRNAVIRFQEANTISVLAPWELEEGTGFVGPTTRAKINEICTNDK